MKKSVITSILAVLTALMTLVSAQNMTKEYLGLPGDNLNLYAVMKLFQESETLEAFERSLNDENSMINNLDLNGDNYVDYIMVSDYVDGNVHTVVLRVALNRKEHQDVAVFTVEKFRNGSVQIQLIGDEALYGRNYIIEPNYAGTPNPGYTGTSSNRVVTTTYYEVGYWPLIRFIYLPDYVIWRSAWYWGYYPVYWNPWSPYYWHYYYGYHYNWHPHYYQYYRHWDHPRYVRYNDFYYSSIRVHSPTVIININKGNYHATYSRPEKRNEGEALYAKRYSMENTGTQNRVAVKSQETTRVSDARNTAPNTTRSTTATVRTRTENSTGVTRKVEDTRKVATPAERTVSSPASVQTTANTRNTTDASRERTVTKTATVKNTVVTRTAPDASSNKTVTRTSPVQNTANTLSTSVKVSDRTPSGTATIQRTAPARTSPAQLVQTSGSTVRTRSNDSNHSTAVKKSSNTGVSENSRTNLR